MNPRARLPVSFLPYAVFLGLVAPWLRAVPIWDAMYYFDCVLRATRPPFPFGSFACADHPPGYLFLAGWPQYLLHGSALALNLANIAWMLFGIAGLARLVDFVSGEVAGATEKALAVTVFASAPLVVAVTYHFSADEGLLVFFPWVLDGFLRRARLQTLLAGLALNLAKEPGVVLYGIAWLAVVGPGLRSGLAGESWKQRLQDAGLLLLPLAAAGVHLMIRQGAGETLFNQEGAFDLGLGARSRGGLALMLLLNFTWLLWAVPLLGWAWRGLRGGGRLGLRLALEGRLAFILVAVGVALTRVVPYRNPRYFVTAFVPLLVLSCAVLLRVAPRPARVACLVLLIGLNVVANYWTVDPLSIAAFGNARYGEMRLHCNYWEPNQGCWGRDQLVYNQQFLEVQAAQDAVFRELRPTSDTTFVVAPDARYLMQGPLDPVSYRRTFAEGASVNPRFVTTKELLAEPARPETLYVLNYPRLGFTGIPRLEQDYEIDASLSYGTPRLKIPVTVMRRR
jgi:hypothetical protein